MPRSLLALTWVSLLGLGGGCNFYKEKPQKDAIPDWSSKNLSYELVRTTVLTPRCVSCHASGGEKVALDSYAAVKANLSRIEKAALRERTMPPQRPLSAAEQGLLRAWIDAGAPENPGPSPTPLPALEPKFASITKRIFEPRCVGCHTEGGTAEKVPLMNWKELLNSPRELVIPGNDDESVLVISVERKDTKRMPPPSSGAPLTLGETRTIRQWIKDGAKDN